MLNFRLETFLVLSEVLNYTETANLLHISQPAVSQHIKHLEEEYNTKLFDYKNKSLSLTKKGEELYEFVASLDSSAKRMKEIIRSKESFVPLKFGTTLTVGEYSMPFILAEFLKDFPNIPLTMEVNNTQTLLDKLHKGSIDFAILEGQFDKSKYYTKKLSDEDFVGVCSPENPISKSTINLEDLFTERLLIREKGSGSREIFESLLLENNYTMDSFKLKTEIGNINAIKKLVANNLGITFLYKKAVKEELQNKSLSILDIKDFNIKREYNFVFLKNSLHKEEFLTWFSYFKDIKNEY